ncbi:MAG: AbrB/MazE/SpoVT family DNA-binding domain-containing protein [Oscillospiraceae bacterium]|nr:AbrB/MazE/SpoVT family DNA-binding domain-containing protein [Oscillospiraceae bacterium]
MEMAKVTSKGQITIPISIRKKLGIDQGDKLLFIDTAEGVLMVNPDMLQDGKKEELAAGEARIEATKVSAQKEKEQVVKAQEETTVIENTSADSEAAIETFSPDVETVDDTKQESTVKESMEDKPDDAADDAAAVAKTNQSSNSGFDVAALLNEIRSIGSKI